MLMFKPLLLTLCMLLAVECILSQPVAEAVTCSGTMYSHVSECEQVNLFGEDNSQTAHFWFGAASTMAFTLVYEKACIKPIPATLLAIATVTAIAVAKEAFIDAHFSRSGVYSTMIGAGAGGLTFTVLRF